MVVVMVVAGVVTGVVVAWVVVVQQSVSDASVSTSSSHRVSDSINMVINTEEESCIGRQREGKGREKRRGNRGKVSTRSHKKSQEDTVGNIL